MSYVSIPLNLSERNCLYKPKPRYTTSEEERNSIGSPSPPRPGTVLSDSPLQTNWLADQFKYFNHSYFRGIHSVPHPSGMEGDPLLSSMIPYSLDCATPHLSPLRTSLPAVINASHYGYHPHPYFHMKMSPPFPGYEQFFYSSMRRPKRIRTAFTPNQLLTLEKAFEKNHYVVGSERKQLAQILGLSETQVKVWFQNRRTKNKRQKQDGESCSQENSSKDCLDCREDSFSDESSSDDETICSNPSPVVSESCENSPKTVSKAIWNPITIEERIPLPQSVMNDRTE